MFTSLLKKITSLRKNTSTLNNNMEVPLEKKNFYLNVYNLLPENYILAFYSDVINLKHLLNKEKISQERLILEKFNKHTIDFLVLDKNLRARAIVLFDCEKCNKKNTELYKDLVKLNIPVFVYEKQDSYKCEDLLKFLDSL